MALYVRFQEMQVEIEFLLGIAPIFTDYLNIFRSEEPLVYSMFDALKTMVLAILRCFLKPDLLKGISMADMCRGLTWRKRITISHWNPLTLVSNQNSRYVKNIQVVFILWSHNSFSYKQLGNSVLIEGVFLLLSQMYLLYSYSHDLIWVYLFIPLVCSIFPKVICF